LIDTAMEIEGMPRNITVHAAGLVVTDHPVSQYVPLAVSNDAIVTQFDMDTIAELGLLKFDFLGLRYLTIIQDACRTIQENHPENDKVYQYICFPASGLPLRVRFIHSEDFFLPL
jgi:DNA polymerase-3 subunit alpha